MIRDSFSISTKSQSRQRRSSSLIRLLIQQLIIIFTVWPETALQNRLSSSGPFHSPSLPIFDSSVNHHQVKHAGAGRLTRPDSALVPSVHLKVESFSPQRAFYFRDNFSFLSRKSTGSQLHYIRREGSFHTFNKMETELWGNLCVFY